MISSDIPRTAACLVVLLLIGFSDVASQELYETVADLTLDNSGCNYVNLWHQT